MDEPRQGGSDRPLTRRELRALETAREQAAAEGAAAEQPAVERPAGQHSGRRAAEETWTEPTSAGQPGSVVPTPARRVAQPPAVEPGWSVPAQAAPLDDAPWGAVASAEPREAPRAPEPRATRGAHSGPDTHETPRASEPVWQPIPGWAQEPEPEPAEEPETAHAPEPAQASEPAPGPAPAPAAGDWSTTAGTTWADDVRWSLHGELPRTLPPEPEDDDVPAALDEPAAPRTGPVPVTRTPVRTSVTRVPVAGPAAGRPSETPAEAPLAPADGPDLAADDPTDGPTDDSPTDDSPAAAATHPSDAPATPSRGVPGPPPRVSAWGAAGHGGTGPTPAQPVGTSWQVVPQWLAPAAAPSADVPVAQEPDEGYPVEWAGVDDEPEPELIPWLSSPAPRDEGGAYPDAYPGADGYAEAYPAQPAPLPTLDDLIAARPDTPAGPAEHGWRGTLRRATGGLLTLRPGPAERERREAVAMLQRPLDGPRTIVVINPKGGAHKTTATLLLAATFGQHRGGYTLAWDNNETRGTLGWRALPANHQRTAVTLLQDLDKFADSGAARIGDLDGYVRSQGSAQFDVLASDEDAASAASIDAFAFRALHRTLARFYRVMVVDTGNNLRASNWQAAVEAADQVVIVSTVREDTAQSAAWAVDALRAQGFEDTVRRAVTVLSDPAPQRDPHLAARLHDHFGRLTRAVVDVPYDKTLVGGAPLDVERLDRRTREAWLRVAAVVAEGL